MSPMGLHCVPRSRRGIPRGHGQTRASAYSQQHHLSGLVLGLASPGALPCPERSPSFNVQFSKKAGGGHFLGFGTEFGQLLIVDTRVEAKVQRDDEGPVGFGRTDRIRTISGSGAAKAVRRGGVESVNFCRSWGVRQPEVVSQYRALVNCIFDLQWAHDDTRIVLAGGDAKIRVHDTETRAEVMVLCGHEGSVKTISVNPLENSVILSGARDGSFALWDTRVLQDTPIHRMTAVEYMELATAPANRVRTRFLSPVEQVYRANDGASNHRKRPRSFVRREEPEFEPSRRDEMSPTAFFRGLPCQSSVTAVHWMPGGQNFLTAGQDGLVKLWDTRYAVSPLQVAGPVDAASSSRRRLSRRGNARSTAPPPQAPSMPLTAAWCPNQAGKAVPKSAAGRRGGGRRVSGASSMRVTGGDVVAEEVSQRGGRPCGVSSVHACDDGSRIAVCTVKNHVSVYSYVAGELRNLGSFTGNENASSYYIKAKLSPDGSLLASGAANDAVCMWQVDRPGPPVARLMGHVNEVTGVDWCRAEQLKLATCSDDETVRIWTIDPLRLAHQAASRQSSSSSSSSSLASTAGVRSSIGDHDRGGVDRRNDGARQEATRGVSSTMPLLEPGTVIGAGARIGEGPSGGDGHPSGEREGAATSFSSMGKFGVGSACAGESFWSRPGRIEQRPHDDSSEGETFGCSGLRRPIAGGGEGAGNQGWAQADRTRSGSGMDNATGSPPQRSLWSTSALSPTHTNGARSGVGHFVLSPNTRSGNGRTIEGGEVADPSCRAEAPVGAVTSNGIGVGGFSDYGDPGSARDFHRGRPIHISSTSRSGIRRSAVAQGAARVLVDENMAPSTRPYPRCSEGTAGVPRNEEAMDTGEPEKSAEESGGAMGVDSTFSGSKQGTGKALSLLADLPKGWSSAARSGKWVRRGAVAPTQQQQQLRQEQERGQEQEDKRDVRQEQKAVEQQKQEGTNRRQAAKRAASHRSPSSLEKKRTLMTFWKRDGEETEHSREGRRRLLKGPM